MPRPIDDIAAAITKAIVAGLAGAKDELTDVAEAGGKAGKGGLFGDVGKLTDIIGGIVGPALDVLAFELPPLGMLKAVEDAGGDGGRGFGLGYLLGNLGYQAVQPFTLPINHAVANIAQTEIYDPGTAATLEVKGLIDHEFGRSEAAGGNLSGEHYDRLVQAALTYPDMLTLLTMRDRSLITDDMLHLALQRHGYPTDWINGILGLSRQLLDPATLALAVLRGNLDEGVGRAYAKILSITDDDFTVLINNTGEPPAPEQLMEALRRGFIDGDRFAKGIRQSRVRNEWQDVELALRYSPMTASDAVRAVVQNYLTDEEGKAIAEQNGLLPEHWTPLRETAGRPLAHDQMLVLYHRGQASLEDVKQAMRESDLKDKYIDAAIELGRRLIPERTIVSMLDHGVGTHEQALQRLLEQGFNQDDAEALIQLGAAQRTTTHKQLSRTDLVTMYEDALLTKAQVVDRLVALGYPSADANAMLQLADIKRQATATRALQKSIEAQFKAHHLTENQAITELEKGGVAPEQARGLLDQWNVVRAAPSRSLTEAQILKAGEDGIISVEDVTARLLGAGLLEADVHILLKMRGLEAYTPLPAPIPPTPPAAGATP